MEWKETLQMKTFCAKVCIGAKEKNTFKLQYHRVLHSNFKMFFFIKSVCLHCLKSITCKTFPKYENNLLLCSSKVTKVLKNFSKYVLYFYASAVSAVEFYN